MNIEWDKPIPGLPEIPHPHPLIPEGYHPEVTPLAFGRARLVITDGEGVSSFWCYDEPAAALVALLVWASHNYNGEPDGWVRALTPECRLDDKGLRRRPDADSEQEYRAH